MSATGTGPSVQAAQKLRFRRVLLGSLTYLCTSAFVLGYFAFGLVPGERVVHYLLAVAAINVMFLWLIASGRNLSFRDPSLTGPQVVAALWPSIYIMYFLAEPQARMTFLIMATVGMLFATLAFGMRRLLVLAAIIVGTYLLLLAALWLWAPERLDLRVEVVTVFAYAVVLLLIAFIGNHIAALRRALRARNQDLEAAVAELQVLATRDPLTRLPNRRSLMEHLMQEQSRSERRTTAENSLCLCLLDVDHFKRVNDTFGHQMGDAVLQQVAQAMTDVLRQGDFVGRFGGEEFLLILPESSREGARVAADRVREAVAGVELPTPGEIARVSVTVSVGVAVHRSGESVEGALARADNALYEAKRQGRDQVVVAPDPDGI